VYKRCTASDSKPRFSLAIDNFQLQAGFLVNPMQKSTTIEGSTASFRCNQTETFDPTIR
jgi:hypothetical protein